ncbi:MAG: 50S ribosomal protein L17 [Candidatus Izemoplasmatales bacterium]|jgi:large subunit ribosomal protein L17|nr:50S ribosomal protein L17 [bacterium]MDZ4197184.1 50S ribosomal protein L17 [Candidatus Izemoplasmatales bacterium]
MARGYSKLNRRSDNRHALIRDLATQLFLHGRIETSVIKAKEIKRVAEKLITLAKRGDLHSIRLAGQTVRDLSINDQTALQKLFKEYGPKYQDRNGGYTRIYRIGNRLGDACPMAILELV